ncbi:MAG: transposase, partial [Clostridia bacterium]|nr:transposase [Clostridia bacterium]
NYDYSQTGAYFITICTKNREQVLSQITVGTSIARPYEIHLTDIGKIVDCAIKEIPNRYDGVFVDNYTVMPNHIHMIIRIENDGGRAMLVPTISRIIQQMKGYVTKQAGKPIWQEKAYDHIIRDDCDYMIRYKYIDDNPSNWLLKQDEYY